MGEKGLIALNILIVVSLLALHYYRIGIVPERIKICDARNHLGELVRVEGIAWKVHRGDAYTSIVLTDDFNSTITVFARFRVEVVPGARISVRGILTEFADTVEIMPEDPGDVMVVSRHYSTYLPVLLANPDRYNGFSVRFPAEVEYTRVIYLNLTDEFGSVRGYVSGYSGDRVAYFHGKVRDSRFYVEFASDRCADGYEMVNTTTILGHNGEKVCLRATVYDYGLKMYVSWKNYTIPVYCEAPEIPSGNVEVEGTFTYDSLSGRYVVYAGNVI